MKVILCEKKSQAESMARGLAQMLSSRSVSRRNCIDVSDYRLYWAEGHLLMVDTQSIIKKLKSFPYFPSDKDWIFVPINSRKRYMLNMMKNDLKSADEIIVATDFGREGELIARLILNYLGYNRRARLYRFWTSASLTPSVVRESMRQLKPLSEFDLLYEEAKARQEADWIVGINLSTKLRNIINDGSSWSLGRVQTPTLAILVKRELEIQDFKPTDYYVIEAKFGLNDFEYKGKLLKSSFDVEEEVEEDSSLQDQKDSYYELKKFGFNKKERDLIKDLVSSNIDSIEKVEIINVKKKTKREKPLKLFTLTSLQTYMSKHYRMSIQETANICQWLYDNEYISYPRTESSYLSTDNYDLVIEVLEQLGRSDLVGKVDIKNKRVFNDKGVTDHHALIPMKEFRSSDKRKQLVYDVIKNSLLAQFYPDYVEDKLVIETLVRVADKDLIFYTSQSAPIQLGWRELFSSFKKGSLISVEKGQEVNLLDIGDIEKQTKPPSRYTDGSLVNVMKNAHLLIPKEEKELRKMMKEKDNPGLGTAATRTGIINSLIERGYVEKLKGSVLKPTDKGIGLVMKLVNKSILVDPIMTAVWEQDLAFINRGKLSRKEFIKKIQNLVIEELKKFDSELDLKDLRKSYKCPLCNKDSVVINKNGAFCSECKFLIFRKFLNKKFTDSQLIKLLNREKVQLNKLKSKNGKVFNAVVEYSVNDKKLNLIFNNSYKKGYIKNKYKSKNKKSKFLNK